MATYNDLSYGSRGDEVKKLQQSLVNAGYDVGSAGADGIFGDDTLNAVKKYQTDKGLDVDGIAGNNTLTSLYGASAPESKPEANTSTAQKTPNSQYSQYAYDASVDAAYQQALQTLQQAQQQKPTYAGTYDNQLQDIYNQIVNRDKFKYDLNSDMLYQQYKDQYVNLGQMAMKDTMGQAAALTGGYGSTYGQMVGQQQYDAYLQQLNDVVPELYGMALDQYNAEGDRMLQQYGMVGDMRDDEYGRYQDALNQYWMNVDRAQGAADDAYNRGYENWYNSQQMGYNRQQDMYERLVSLMTTTGYSPSADELTAAGMSAGEMQAYLNYYAKMNPAPVACSGSGSGNPVKKKTPDDPSKDPKKEPTLEDDLNAMIASSNKTGSGVKSTKDDVNKIINDTLKKVLNNPQATEAEKAQAKKEAAALKETYAPRGYTY